MTAHPPTTSTPTTSKRHSLSLTTSTGPRPLRLVDTGSVPATAPSSFPGHSLPFSASSNVEPSNSTPPSSNANKIKRSNLKRQSISYHTGDRDIGRNFEREHDSQGLPLVQARALSRSGSLGSASPRNGTIRGDRKSAESTPSDSMTPERAPSTLTERYSDLLHFIAQKESKCLELRSQLAVHEAELLQLKRKWEQIISRGLDGPNTPNTSINRSNPSPAVNGNSAVLEGIREGVQGVGRIIAGFSSTPPPTPSSPLPATSSVTNRGHSAQQSTSSASTYATTKSSCRLSQSSVSSFGDELRSPSIKEEKEHEELMVNDTGAYPVMSPTLAFKVQGRRNSRTKSKSLEDADDVSDGSAGGGTGSGSSSTNGQSPSASIKRAKNRASMSGLPPASSIPGLGSLLGGGPPVSSWMGTASKTWEELQKGPTFSKHQKRASLLISDVSQSIVSAISSSPLVAQPPAFPSPTTSKPAVPSPTTTSLIDEDDPADEDLTAKLGTVMSPNKPSEPTFRPPSPTPSMSTANSGSGNSSTAQSEAGNEDDEWNW